MSKPVKPVARFSLSEAEWDVMRDAMHTELIDAAKQKRILTYGDLALLLPIYVHPGSYAFTRLLSQVCAASEQAGEGMLCALVVSKSTKIPGAGFFRGAAERGIDMSDYEHYWRDEVERLFAQWDGA